MGKLKKKKRRQLLTEAPRAESASRVSPGQHSSDTTVDSRLVAKRSKDAQSVVPKDKRIWREVVPHQTVANGFHNYNVDALDHAETDIRAYQHLSPLLEAVAKHLSKPIAKLGLWDPYFCKGGMIKRLASLGYKKVHNVNEDFYSVIASGNLPEYDVILSSPPYSADHLERCLRFCAKQGKVWCLLLPNWVESRPYFKDVLGGESANVFYISPVQRFTYWMPPDLVSGKSKPEWVGKDGGTSPYDSTWFVHLPSKMPRKNIFEALERHPNAKKDWVVANSLRAARFKVKNMAKRGRAQDMVIGGEEPLAPSHPEGNKGVKRKNKLGSNAVTKRGKLDKSSKWGNTICFD